MHKKIKFKKIWKYYIFAIFILIIIQILYFKVFLSLSIVEKKTSLTAFLLNHGADIHVRHEEPLIFAALDGNMEVEQLLLDHGADVNANRAQALFISVQNGNLENTKFLIEHGANIKGCSGHVFAKVAYDYNHKNIMDYIYEKMREMPPIDTICPYAKAQ